jgi:pyruvate/2-oxoglutarate dehydrogenase complex dihydrolipoamide dehydrogenase (E3) component
MFAPDHYELLVIGSGEAGKYLAWHMARAGHRVAVIERKLIGGSCPNTNCLPSKNEIWSAKVADLVRQAHKFGSITGPATVDMGLVLARKRAMVDGLVDMHVDLFKASGAELIMGHARLTAPKTVEVNLNDGSVRLLTAERLVLCLGTRATIPDIPGLTAAMPLTNVEILELGTVPDHLIVLGGGYVGMEFAQCFRRFGSAVTVIEQGAQLAAREDPDVGQALRALLEDEGISVELGARVTGVEGQSGETVTVRLNTPGGDRVIAGSHILISAGRTPNTTGVGLDQAGVTLDGRGFVVVNDRLETSAAKTWAVGDCAGSPQFTHAAFDDYRLIRDNWAGGTRTTHNRLIPYCMYTDPPLARVGLSPGDAARLGKAVRVATLPVASVLRARTISETRGFLQAVVDAESDLILGFTMIGPDAGEVLATVQTAMLAGMPYMGLRDAILSHPTMVEGLNGLFARVPAR